MDENDTLASAVLNYQKQGKIAESCEYVSCP